MVAGILFVLGEGLPTGHFSVSVTVFLHLAGFQMIFFYYDQ